MEMIQGTMRSMAIIVLLLLAASASAPRAQGSGPDGRTYPDGRGGDVHFPLGAVSFADEIVSFHVGNPDGGAASTRPEMVLGPPDFDPVRDTGYLTLGCGGVLTVAFTDNALIDVPGPDLYVFEIGPDIEPTGLAISSDGEDWRLVGIISGGKAEVDITDFVRSDEIFRFVQLTDLRTACGEFAGADIDSIGAIGSAAKLSLDSAVLFDTGKHELKPTAALELDMVITRIPAASDPRLVIHGHTDSVGSEEDNLALSERRAGAVAAYLVAAGAVDPDAVETRGYGELQPVATNDTAEGRQRNRRVEIVVQSQIDSSEGSQRTPATILGVWSSSEGLMEVRQTSGGVGGVYGRDGRLEGAFSDDRTFEGYWIQPHARRECSEERAGSRFWGRIILNFADAGLGTFNARWGYCEDEAGNGGWAGERLL